MEDPTEEASLHSQDRLLHPQGEKRLLAKELWSPVLQMSCLEGRLAALRMESWRKSAVLRQGTLDQQLRWDLALSSLVSVILMCCLFFLLHA